MKILQIYELDPVKRIGGVEVAILNLTRNLAALGHEVTIACGADTECGEYTRDSVHFIYLDFCGIVKKIRSHGGLSLARQIAYLPTILSKQLNGYDIYHGHLYASGIAANILARRYGGVAVNTIHGSYYPEWYKLVNPAAAAFYRIAERILAPALANMSDMQIHTGSYFAQQVLTWGAETKKIRVIHNGVDSKRFNPKAKKAISDCQFPVIVTARRLVRKNGVDRLLQAMPQILKNHECKLIVIGDGPERNNLRRLSEKLSLGQSVEFLGAVPHDDIAKYIALADIAVVPSIVEASSIFMLEAMAMCKPVVATEAWGLAEIIDGSNGVITDADHLGEEISGLLNDEHRLRELGMNARKYVIEKHSWEKIAKRVESEYLRLKERY
ncbi:MAG: glycosyltransferase family 4 protein [Candidatus Methanoperedens sp.]|nr:glycosyltransferase family 4 protein [Candidatus Methanoperedens sp.]MCZ7360996.1 glycosyltransferase family 4 protein [Candidatus Methanoperedens sp.]HLB69889.1 glycosyltransferase family 4 protein [Candidatus Methanoperedens sp.]